MKYFLKENKCEQNVNKIAHLIKKQESETLVFKWWALEDCLGLLALNGNSEFCLRDFITWQKLSSLRSQTARTLLGQKFVTLHNSK